MAEAEAEEKLERASVVGPPTLEEYLREVWVLVDRVMT